MKNNNEVKDTRYLEIHKPTENDLKKDLKQNKGIYIKIAEPTTSTSGKITVILSLHKFYNEMKGEKRQNWNDFNFKQAKEAKILLDEFLL